jgi:hypothetical protein
MNSYINKYINIINYYESIKKICILTLGFIIFFLFLTFVHFKIISMYITKIVYILISTYTSFYIILNIIMIIIMFKNLLTVKNNIYDYISHINEHYRDIGYNLQSYIDDTINKYKIYKTYIIYLLIIFLIIIGYINYHYLFDKNIFYILINVYAFIFSIITIIICNNICNRIIFILNDNELQRRSVYLI